MHKLNQFHFGTGCDSPPSAIPLSFTEPMYSDNTMPATHRTEMLAGSPQGQQQSTTAPNHLPIEMVPPSGHWCVPARILSLFGHNTSSTFGLGCDDEVMLDFLYVLRGRLGSLEAV